MKSARNQTYKAKLVNGGHIEYKTGKIVLDDSASQQIEDQTLIHEIAHGMLVEAGYVQHEEEQADRIGKILYQVLTDNDFSWLWKGGTNG
ncbi:hypothetical protein [Streptococcus suis]|uniref:hypothetical protein n=1 Tax=Streptococcus suis TaxID=1307 RepID=UPI00209C6B9F|nr:hypothetical protein [Streptococcus suis]MCO8228358.1 hypothetical protein [Streptococcus suis]